MFSFVVVRFVIVSMLVVIESVLLVVRGFLVFML